MHPKCEIYFSVLVNLSNNSMAILHFSLFLPTKFSIFQLCESKSGCSWYISFVSGLRQFCKLVHDHDFFSVLLPIQLRLLQQLLRDLLEQSRKEAMKIKNDNFTRNNSEKSNISNAVSWCSKKSRILHAPILFSSTVDIVFTYFYLVGKEVLCHSYE